VSFRIPLALRKIIPRITRSEVNISSSYIIFRTEKRRISLQPWSNYVLYVQYNIALQDGGCKLPNFRFGTVGV